MQCIPAYQVFGTLSNSRRTIASWTVIFKAGVGEEGLEDIGDRPAELNRGCKSDEAAAIRFADQILTAVWFGRNAGLETNGWNRNRWKQNQVVTHHLQ